MGRCWNRRPALLLAAGEFTLVIGAVVCENDKRSEGHGARPSPPTALVPGGGSGRGDLMTQNERCTTLRGRGLQAERRACIG